MILVNLTGMIKAETASRRNRRLSEKPTPL